MPLKLTKKAAVGTVSEQKKSGGQILTDETTEQKVELPETMSAQQGGEAPWCEVGVDASYTKNMGNYESAKFGVNLRVPCQQTEIDQAFKFANDWVDAKMQEIMAEL